MKIMFKWGLAVAGLLLVASCTSFELEGLTYSNNEPGVEALGDFTVEVWAHEFLGAPGGVNLFNVTANEMNGPIRDAIEKEIENRSGDAAINVKVLYEATFLNILANAVTFGIYAPATAIITGTVVTYN